MRLSWNEIRVRAARFARDWKDARYERGECQTFYNEFFQIFGVTRRRVATFEEPVRRLGDRRGFIDLFWKGVLLVEQKSAGGNLIRAKEQALDYFPGLKEVELPRHVLVSDFQTFELFDLDEGTHVSFFLTQLPERIEHFGFILGVQKRAFRDQDPVNIEASELMGQLHDVLEASGYTGHHLEQFLVRLLFCLFADDNGIFEPRDIFMDLIKERTQPDGSDVGALLSHLFEVLNSSDDERQKNLDEDLARFPYINGALFEERLPIPSFDGEMRGILINACEFRWDEISPAIFGSLFQSVMNPKERREQGAHYTSEKNILKLIQPLFLDDLRSEFERLKARRDTARRAALSAFHDKLSSLTFFDPACGCGNFLIISYRELRLLEIELLQELQEYERTKAGEFTAQIDVSLLTKIDVDQFYGIEINEFPVRIAEVALWMMDHIMNNRLSLAFGQNFARIPLRKSPHIVHADALEMAWDQVLDPARCNFLLGNPPFLGKKEQSSVQKNQVRRVFGNVSGSGELDYVACWFHIAASFCEANGAIDVAFVSTKSITQGEQVALVWNRLVNQRGFRINFAHRTFEWQSEARGKAHVHVTIIGFSRRDRGEKRLFDYSDVKGEPNEIKAANINPYLIDGPNILVTKANRPISPRPQISKGSEATDFGFLTLSPEERDALMATPNFNPAWIRLFVGGDEYINNLKRYCLWLVDADPSEIRRCAPVAERIANVANKRLESPKERTVEYAKYPSIFGENRQPSSDYIIIPKVSSQRRQYVPMGFLSSNVIVSGSAQFIETNERWILGILVSEMHMAWMRAVGGRTKSDYQYTNTLVYNTFPWPEISAEQRQQISQLVEHILDARNVHTAATLADLYDPTTMPAALRRAHEALDRSVDRLYRRTRFDNERERVRHLFELYAHQTAPLAPALITVTRRGRRRAG
jgi:hypothetical protein